MVKAFFPLNKLFSAVLGVFGGSNSRFQVHCAKAACRRAEKNRHGGETRGGFRLKGGEEDRAEAPSVAIGLNGARGVSVGDRLREPRRQPPLSVPAGQESGRRTVRLTMAVPRELHPRARRAVPLPCGGPTGANHRVSGFGLDRGADRGGVTRRV